MLLVAVSEGDMLDGVACLETADLGPTPISSEYWGSPATVVRDPDGRALVFTKEDSAPGSDA